MADQFKRLGFVESTACSALDTAGSTYSTARDKTLHATNFMLEGLFTKVESVVGPLLAFSKRHSHDMLLFVDTTVDKSVSAVAHTAKYSREQATKLVGEERVKPVENLASDTMATVSATLNDRLPAAARSVHARVHDSATGLYNAVAGALNGAAQRVMDGVRTADKAVAGTASGMQARAAAAKDSVYTSVVVPVSGYTKNAYLSMRDAVTTQPLYAKGYYSTAAALAAISGAAPVKSAASLFSANVYPLIAPVAAPLVATGAPYVAAALREAKPSDEAKRAANGGDGGAVKEGELTMKKVEKAVNDAPAAVKARNGKVAAKPAAPGPGAGAKDE